MNSRVVMAGLVLALVVWAAVGVRADVTSVTLHQMYSPNSETGIVAATNGLYKATVGLALITCFLVIATAWGARTSSREIKEASLRTHEAIASLGKNTKELWDRLLEQQRFANGLNCIFMMRMAQAREHEIADMLGALRNQTVPLDDVLIDVFSCISATARSSAVLARIRNADQSKRKRARDDLYELLSSNSPLAGLAQWKENHGGVDSNLDSTAELMEKDLKASKPLDEIRREFRSKI